MFRKILILNRGEIAVRIIRTCREMGIRTATVFSEADRNCMHVHMADEAYALKGNTPGETYLHLDHAIEVAERSHVEAIHPGYGFLSENPEFAQRVDQAGIKFIGPPAQAIRALGDKTAARQAAQALGIPTIPGTKEALADEREAESAAKNVGYPILLKAAAGGGGKGMRVVNRREELTSALKASRSEALSAFGDDRVYVEKLLDCPGHVEIQILADSFGNAIHLGERECSIQRRHQKLIEEAPSTFIDEGLRRAMGQAAVQLAQSVGYVNAGTVEFLVDGQRRFYFLEVNTRLQVEHPVTEMLTGIDLVRQQILIAAGQRIPFTQEQVVRHGHAIECRVCAEDPEDHFFPSAGILKQFVVPQGPNVRVDTGCRVGDNVSIFYDPLMAKVTTWGQDRNEAIGRMKRALAEFIVQGVKSTIPFSLFAMDNAGFRAGKFDINFVDAHYSPQNLHSGTLQEEIAAAVAAVLLHSGAQQRRPQLTTHQNRSSAWKRIRLEEYR